MKAYKNILICADDYAQTEAISEGILILAAEQRLNAISSMVNSSYWASLYRDLETVSANTFLGLHLNLSSGQALSPLWKKNHSSDFWGLPKLIRRSYLRQLDKAAIEAEIAAQLDAFTTALGREPDFIDGHQHVHQLPMIRDCLISIFKSRKLQGFCRSTANGWNDFYSLSGFPKRQLISLLGGLCLRSQLQQHGIRSNSSFAGIYGFATVDRYRGYFQNFLKNTRDGGLIMCHPGVLAQDSSDPLLLSRHVELSYLQSEDLLKDLEAARARLIPKNQLVL